MVFLFAFRSRFDYRNLYDDRQGFVGTPGPAMWRGSPACFAAERPPPRVSFLRVFGPCGLQPFSQQSAPRLNELAGVVPRAGYETPEQVMSVVREGVKTYTDVLRAAGVKPE